MTAAPRLSARQVMMSSPSAAGSARSAGQMRAASASQAAKAKPVGPHELCPSPCAPRIGQGGDRGGDAPACEAAALRGREMVADDLLHAGDRATEGRQIRLGQCRRAPAAAPRRQISPDMAGGIGARVAKAAVSCAPDKPSSARSSSSRMRQAAGTPRRASNGGGASRPPRPPSTTSPPRVNSPMPMPERPPRSSVCASARGSGASPCRPAQRRRHGQRELRAGPQAGMRGNRGLHRQLVPIRQAERPRHRGHRARRPPGLAALDRASSWRARLVIRVSGASSDRPMLPNRRPRPPPGRRSPYAGARRGDHLDALRHLSGSGSCIGVPLMFHAAAAGATANAAREDTDHGPTRARAGLRGRRDRRAAGARSAALEVRGWLDAAHLPHDTRGKAR